MISYHSTRDRKAEHRLTASQAILKGLADDGGLFVPSSLPSLPEGLDTSLGDGMLTIETGSGSYTMDVDVSGGLVNVSGDIGSTYIFIPGTVLWTMGDDYVLMKGGSILSYDGSEYSLVVNRLVA